MRIEDMATWTVDQLKEEVVRLADERETKQHEILDKDNKIKGAFTLLFYWRFLFSMSPP